MILAELKQYISQKKSVNLMQLIKHFNCDEHVIRDMLNLWINKGMIKKSNNPPGCGSKCSKCLPLMVEFYHWCDK